MDSSKLSVFPIGEKNEAFAAYFKGQSYLNMLTTQGLAVGNVIRNVFKRQGGRGSGNGRRAVSVECRLDKQVG